MNRYDTYRPSELNEKMSQDLKLVYMAVANGNRGIAWDTVRNENLLG